jgi:metal-responsive CopG/Arc/MetJ family transcriptional regulator
MVTEMITVKLEKKFLNEIDRIIDRAGYQSRTEFIRNWLRKGMEEEKLKQVMLSLAPLKGASSKKTSDKELERMREKAFEELSKKFR